jgi:hypothetical protein
MTISTPSCHFWSGAAKPGGGIPPESARALSPTTDDGGGALAIFSCALVVLAALTGRG